MPTSGRQPRIALVNTSVAVALVVEDHVAHERTAQVLRGRLLGLAGHSYFESYSVLTRLPSPLRRSPAEVTRLLEHDFPETRFLGADDARVLARRLASLGIAGGSVYDALVGATAAQHDLALATRDRRALDIYRALDVNVLLIE